MEIIITIGYNRVIIDTLRQQLHKVKIFAEILKDWTTAMTVVFVVGMSAFNMFLLGYVYQPVQFAGAFAFIQEESGDFQGEEYRFGAASLIGKTSVDIGMGSDSQEVRFIIINDAALVGANNPLSNALPTREGLMIYKVQRGDNLSRIAANFGISLNTILWANEGLRPSALQPGQEIVILPVTGVLHQIQSGETLEQIALQYGVSVEKILNANPNLIPSRLSLRPSIIIPESAPLRASALASSRNLPNLPGYFAIPTTGWNWGQLHNYNAIDIANACGTPIYAAAEGLIVEERSRGWNEGYGRYIVIEHPNGTKTKYAHNRDNFVSLGDYVVKGDQIATIGNTGLTHGPTGCHLHFEVFNARNPFAK